MDKHVYEFISQQTNDPIVERKICAVSGQEFAIFQSDLDFYDKISPTFNGQRFQIPTPTLCPEERERRRLTFRNERKFYKRKCDGTGKDIISTYRIDAPYTVYDTQFRWSDGRDVMQYGRDYDFSQNFSEQFKELLHDVPKMAIINDNGVTSENCAYCHDFAYGKNSYFVTGSRRVEDSCYAGNQCNNSTHIMDCSYLRDSHYCYECVDAENLHNCLFVMAARQCHDCGFSFDIQGCTHCFFCNNLRNKNYCLYNKQYSKEEYEKEIAHIKNMMLIKGGITSLEEQYKKILQSAVHQQRYNRNSQRTFGTNNTDSKNAICCFDMYKGVDCKYIFEGDTYTKSYDLSISGQCELGYEGLVPDMGYMVLFDIYSQHCKYVYYSDSCYYCTDCFGCVGLKHKQYCIFNTQYTKEEYETKVPAIITHMQSTGERGEFFDPSVSPYAYNETVAQNYFPLTRDEAIQKGYTWLDTEYPINIPASLPTIHAEDMTDDTTNDDILQKAILCAETGRPFRIVALELELYRKLGLPLPLFHPDVRHQKRLLRKSARTLHLRTCSKTGIDILSVYPQNASFPVYSEEAYNKEVYG